MGKRRKTKANPNPQPKLKPKPEPKPALKLNPKPKPKPGPKPPAPAALVKRRNRAVFRVADPSRRRIVVVKRYDDWRDAVSERDVMRSYGKARHLVRMYRWRKRDGRGYIIMEYVRGSTLNEVIARRGALPPAKVRALALSVLDGLHQLHRRGFVHGDLHGRNVIVTDYDKAKVRIIDLQHAVKLGPSGRGRAKRIVPDPPPWLPPESPRRVADPRLRYLRRRVHVRVHAGGADFADRGRAEGRRRCRTGVPAGIPAGVPGGIPADVSAGIPEGILAGVPA